MYFFDITITALTGLTSNKLRTSLATLGIIIGVAAVIAMMAVTRGAADSVTSNIKSLGTDLIFIRAGARRHGVLRTGEVKTLTLQDALAIERTVPGVIAVSPEVAGSVQAKYYSENKNTTVMGTGVKFSEIRNFAVIDGNFFDEKDFRLGRKVAVLGNLVKTELFKEQPAVNRTIRIKGIPFKVIGVLEEKGDRGWYNPDDQILVPLSTAQKRLFGMDHLKNITVKVASTEKINEVVGKISTLLRKRHKLPYNRESDFNIRTQLEMLESLSEVTSTLKYLLAGIASISLLVGGIGIMNIMLVTVTERTREIGVRKALGATRNDVLFQFLVESVAISGLGGAIGIALGYIIAASISYFGGWETSIMLNSVALALMYSIVIGVVFGVYPAYKAANMEPVEALRYE